MYTAVDVHVNGEAFRVMKDVPCKYYYSLEQLNEQFSGELAEERKLLLNEPRGFIGLNGCIVVPSIHNEVDAAVLFLIMKVRFRFIMGHCCGNNDVTRKWVFKRESPINTKLKRYLEYF